MDKKYLILVFCSLFLISSVSAFSGGDGTQSNPYQVDTISDFQEIDGMLPADGVYFEQTSDLNFSGVEGSNYMVGGGCSDAFSCNGNQTFRGIYNGQGFQISNFNLDISNFQSNNNTYLGLFGFNRGSVIKNIYMKDTRVYNIANADRVGGLTGGGKMGADGKYSSVYNVMMEGVSLSVLDETSGAPAGSIAGITGTTKYENVFVKDVTLMAGSNGNMGGFAGSIYNGYYRNTFTWNVNAYGPALTSLSGDENVHPFASGDFNDESKEHKNMFFISGDNPDTKLEDEGNHILGGSWDTGSDVEADNVSFNAMNGEYFDWDTIKYAQDPFIVDSETASYKSATWLEAKPFSDWDFTVTQQDTGTGYKRNSFIGQEALQMVSGTNVFKSYDTGYGSDNIYIESDFYIDNSDYSSGDADGMVHFNFFAGGDGLFGDGLTVSFIPAQQIVAIDPYGYGSGDRTTNTACFNVREGSEGCNNNVQAGNNTIAVNMLRDANTIEVYLNGDKLVERELNDSIADFSNEKFSVHGSSFGNSGVDLYLDNLWIDTPNQEHAYGYNPTYHRTNDISFRGGYNEDATAGAYTVNHLFDKTPPTIQEFIRKNNDYPNTEVDYQKGNLLEFYYSVSDSGYFKKGIDLETLEFSDSITTNISNKSFDKGSYERVSEKEYITGYFNIDEEVGNIPLYFNISNSNDIFQGEETEIEVSGADLNGEFWQVSDISGQVLNKSFNDGDKFLPFRNKVDGEFYNYFIDTEDKYYYNFEASDTTDYCDGLKIERVHDFDSVILDNGNSTSFYPLSTSGSSESGIKNVIPSIYEDTNITEPVTKHMKVRAKSCTGLTGEWENITVKIIPLDTDKFALNNTEMYNNDYLNNPSIVGYKDEIFFGTELTHTGDYEHANFDTYSTWTYFDSENYGEVYVNNDVGYALLKSDTSTSENISIFENIRLDLKDYAFVSQLKVRMVEESTGDVIWSDVYPDGETHTVRRTEWVDNIDTNETYLVTYQEYYSDTGETGPLYNTTDTLEFYEEDPLPMKFENNFTMTWEEDPIIDSTTGELLQFVNTQEFFNRSEVTIIPRVEVQDTYGYLTDVSTSVTIEQDAVVDYTFTWSSDPVDQTTSFNVEPKEDDDMNWELTIDGVDSYTKPDFTLEDGVYSLTVNETVGEHDFEFVISDSIGNSNTIIGTFQVYQNNLVNTFKDLLSRTSDKISYHMSGLIFTLFFVLGGGFIAHMGTSKGFSNSSTTITSAVMILMFITAFWSGMLSGIYAGISALAISGLIGLKVSSIGGDN